MVWWTLNFSAYQRSTKINDRKGKISHGTRPEISQEADYYILEQHEEEIMLLIQMQKEDDSKKTIGCD